VEKIEDPVVIERSDAMFSITKIKTYDIRRPIFRYGIKGAKVHLRSGVSSLFGGFLVEEFYSSYMAIFGSGSIIHEYRKIQRNKFEKLQGTWVVVEIPRYYFHFIAQTLPTILRSLNHSSKPRIICHKDAPRWLRELLITLDPDTYFSNSEIVYLEEAIFTSAPEVSSQSEVDLLRKSITNFSKSKNSEYCFIGRIGRHRNLGKFEFDLTDELLRNGKIVTDPEKLSWEEELDFFASIGRAVIVNGSGVANLAWMQPGSEVIILINGDDFSTQIEKAFISACEISVTEIDVREYDNREAVLISELLEFLS
jgi:capsular polysaccharide biosynthesis protein